MPSFRLLASSLVLAAGVGFLAPACGGATTNSADPGGGDPNNPITKPGGDMPCEVAAVLANCTGCHSNPPTQAAPMALVSAADLAADSPYYPGQNEATRALVRMKDTTSPMPPSGHEAPTADEIAAFQKWVDAGMPAGTCDNPAATVDAGPDPFAVPPTCTSGKTWTLGNHGSTSMHPGVACIACHKKEADPEVPQFAVAGTVYPSAHEPDDCMSAVPGGTASVIITEADGKTHTLPVNTAGNFSYVDRTGTFKLPYKAKVVSGGKERVMTDAQTDGDCNGCHTQTGSKGSGTKVAPGRIILP
jgi:hypothetical protein